MSHRKSDLGIPCPRKICQSSVRACTHKIAIGDSDLINVRCGPLCRLESDISRGPRSANSGHSAKLFNHLVGTQQELTWTTQRQITLTSTFQNAITTLTLGFPPSSVLSCTVTRITTLGFFSRAFAHSRSIIFAFSTSVSRRCMNILQSDKWPRGRRAAEQRDELAPFHSIT